MSRYIDADALITDLNKGLWGKDWDKVLADRYINLDDAKARTTQLYHGYEVEQWLDTIPSINIDRPQGKWIAIRQCSHGKIERCSRCGKKYRVLCKWNFCPNCGARMKGADDE